MFNFQLLITQISGPEIMFALSLIIAGVLYLKNYRKDFYKVFFSSTIAMCATLLTKYLFKMPRPVHMLIAETGYGFPSGHATMAAVAMSLGIYYSHKHVKNKTARYFLYALSIGWYILVSYSRLYLQVHYLIDVIAGGVVGVLSTVVVLKIFKHFHYYNK